MQILRPKHDRHGGIIMETKAKKSFVEIFMDGAFKGWNIGIKSMVTSLILANVIIYMLNASGLLSLIEVVFTPIMRIFGLPGAAIAVLIAGFLSKPGGAGAAAALYAQGILTAEHVTIVFPAVIIMGALVGQYVRIVVLSGVEAKRHGLIFALVIGVAFLSMFVMKILVGIM